MVFAMKKKMVLRLTAAAVSALLIAGCFLSGCGKNKRVTAETAETTFGIDVARYQGTIDWKEVAGSGIDFAMIRVGYRGYGTGAICADSYFETNIKLFY